MKTSGRFVFVLLLLFAMSAAVHGQYLFLTNNGGITITGYFGPGGSVVIPSTITGLPVRAIGLDAFDGRSSVTSVTIPTTLVTLGPSAFHNCYGLTSVVIPNSVTSIGDYAFSGCDSLPGILIPGAVTNIGTDVFVGCTSLPAISVDPANGFYSATDGVLFNKDQTTLLAYPAGKGGAYTIPPSVSRIADYAFDSSFGLTAVTMGSGVTNIGNYAFYNCGRTLTSVIFANGLLSIGEHAFDSCEALTNVTVPDSVTSIGNSAFAGCLSVGSIAIGQGATNIGDYVFQGCTSLTNITLSDHVMGNGMFSGCDALASVTIPDSISSIPYEAFENCITLNAVSISGSVTSIGSIAFWGCASLERIVIPAAVTNIGSWAFESCSNLQGAYFIGDAPSADSSVFMDDSQAVAYYVPCAGGWGPVFGGAPTALWLPEVQSGRIGVPSNQFGFNINWASGRSVVIEASTNVTHPVWTPVATNTIVGGSSLFIDPQWTSYRARFYRVRSSCLR